ncbi:MAG: GFA family protein [Burkholderiales bacterium]|nr:GFA family protein [Burkholderiales bacterium]
MQLEGSCHCGSVRFSVDAYAPYPYLRCYCGICRKTAGSGGFAVNLGAHAASLRVTGRRHLRAYQARLDDGSISPARRHFCGRCGSALWVDDPRWPELVHPHAGAIDTALPAPPAHVHMMLASKPGWVAAEGAPDDERCAAYPAQSLADWHRAHGLGEG